VHLESTLDSHEGRRETSVSSPPRPWRVNVLWIVLVFAGMNLLAWLLPTAPAVVALCSVWAIIACVYGVLTWKASRSVGLCCAVVIVCGLSAACLTWLVLSTGRLHRSGWLLCITLPLLSLNVVFLAAFRSRQDSSGG